MTNKNDEIDLIELYKIIWNQKFFILVFTFLVTLLAIVYVYMKTPIYEVKAFIEIGTIDDNLVIENPNNVVQRLKIIYMNNPLKKTTMVTKVKVVNNTVNLVEINVQALSNKEAVSLLNNIINGIENVHKSKIDNYIGFINTHITNLKKQEKELKNDKNKFDGSMLVKYNLISKVNDLSLKISSNNIKETQIMGNFITNEYPIRPKKKLIVVVAFVTGFILSIFLVFFMQFIQNIKRNSNKEEK